MHSSHVHVSTLEFISTPGIFLFSFTNLFSMLKIGCFWVSTIFSLICIIPQNMLLVGLRLCLMVLHNVWVVFS
jgi:hypothetical protein